MIKVQIYQSLGHLLDNITVTYLLLAIAGQTLHILSRLKAVAQKKEKFIWHIFIIQNLLNTTYSGIAMIILLLVFAGSGQLNGSTAFLLGYSTDNLIKRLIETTRQTMGVTETDNTETNNNQNDAIQSNQH